MVGDGEVTTGEVARGLKRLEERLERVEENTAENGSHLAVIASSIEQVSRQMESMAANGFARCAARGEKIRALQDASEKHETGLACIMPLQQSLQEQARRIGRLEVVTERFPAMCESCKTQSEAACSAANGLKIDLNKRLDEMKKQADDDREELKRVGKQQQRWLGGVAAILLLATLFGKPAIDRMFDSGTEAQGKPAVAGPAAKP